MVRANSAEHPDRVFHHPDPIHTSFGEWLFMGFVVLAILVGLPVVLGLVFHYVVPWIGRLMVH
jgi:hypothetical protein